MKDYYAVEVECKEDGQWVSAGSYNGVAGSIEEAIRKAVGMAKDGAMSSESCHRAVSATRVGAVAFGAGKK